MYVSDVRTVFAAAALFVLACSGTTAQTSPIARSTTSTPPPANLQPTPGGCGQTEVHQGAVPAWLDQATGHNVPIGLPYVIGSPDVVGGFLFAHPLRAGHPQNPSNKILWAVRTPRQGSALQIDGHPLDAPGPVVHESQPANSGPGEIYPDGVDVPSPGCWRFTLRWATNRAEVDLNYVPA